MISSCDCGHKNVIICQEDGSFFIVSVFCKEKYYIAHGMFNDDGFMLFDWMDKELI